jgi:hypothetical protein
MSELRDPLFHHNKQHKEKGNTAKGRISGLNTCRQINLNEKRTHKTNLAGNKKKLTFFDTFS